MTPYSRTATSKQTEFPSPFDLRKRLALILVTGAGIVGIACRGESFQNAFDTPPQSTAALLAPQMRATQISTGQNRPNMPLPEGARESWWSQVQANLRADEYRVTPAKPGVFPDAPTSHQAANRAQNLRTYFTPKGPRLVSRSERQSSWSASLGLDAMGRGQTLTTVGAPRIVTRDNRVEYVRAGVTEWYVNDEKGVEQGFLVEKAPQGEGDLVLRLVSGATTPKLTGDNVVEFVTADAVSVLRYSGLHAFSQTGEKLASRMEVKKGAIHLRVTAKDTDFPVTIDPFVTNVSWTAESDQAGAGFGLAVASAGDVNGDGYSDVLVGAPFFDNGSLDEGRAYLFHGSATGLAASPAWTAEGDQAGAWFGYSLASAGDVNGDGYADVIVGAYGYDSGQPDEGKAFTFHGSAAGLTAVATWTAESNQVAAYLGYSVASAGDVNGDGYADVIVGAPFYDGGEVNEGRASVYYGSIAGLAAAPGWGAESNQPGALFAYAFASAGDINADGYADVAVGAPMFDAGETDEGRVFVYHGSAAGLTIPKTTREGNQVSALFGVAIASAGDVNGDGYSDVIVGASQYDNGQFHEGRAFVYSGSIAGLSLAPIWTAESNQLNARFGSAVASAGDVNGDGYADVLVGADYFDNGQVDEGKAFLYLGGGAGPAATAIWTEESDQSGARFGASVASAGDVNGDGYADIAVGANMYDAGQLNEGRAFLYLGAADVPQPSPAWTIFGDLFGGMGASVAPAGDVNGDGFSDVIVGAPWYDNGGRAYVYYGGPSGLSAVSAWMAEGNQVDAHFGGSVGAAGDVNGDGYSDVIVGAPYYGNAGGIGNGRAYVYLSSVAGLAASASWVETGTQSHAHLGTSVASAGDVNGDGFADVVVGAPDDNSQGNNGGKASVYYGSVGGVAPLAAWSAYGSGPASSFGRDVGSAGDVNGDGFADLVVGVPVSNFNPDGPQPPPLGHVAVYFGGASGPALGPSWTSENGSYSSLGDTGSAGDVNGDGYDDLLISFGGGVCRLALYHGGLGGLPAAPSTVVEEPSWYSFGTSAGTVGDVDGDGFADVVVGAPMYSSGEGSEGAVFIFRGSAAGVVGPPAWLTESNANGALLGASVASAGDVNGDGYADIIAGAPNHNLNVGAAFVYYGNSAGRLVKPQQRKGGANKPHVIQRWGFSRSTDSFRVSARATSPVGRQRVKLEVQACPPGVPFGGPTCVTSVQPAWSDVTATGDGAPLTHEVKGLTNGVVYHWRSRVLYAPYRITQPGITAPPNPLHGPWHRLEAQALTADVRVGTN